ncbi:hypothetical protein MTX26_15375 [Bradyrhizobium sp. ISRA443]|uniref:hypothetical protein n=1 Tax=unclassified Bradyrhizobium TaxID=2631580 RepID=UPI00247A403C|nr:MULTISPECIES: hypothetical protein [unclassified Bradyrhizobium]WGS02111.1 hypothetical protein MTX23_15385 [Bradyrhizobium sp. ISRA436]WGS08996.1 hypothetical protein MTX18_15375 [Bradyrhizobium sp. ISRA437]WGS15885.1 hypothetical protein MTX26_15375 [Bradyrhizobium sp. ISRA443]
MNWAWASSLDQIWRSPTFPTWLTLAAAGFFGIVVLVTLLRAEKSVANGALTVITLLSIAVAVAATIRGFGPGGQTAPAETRTAQATGPTLPALACVDDLAGDAVLNACEKVLFGSADSAAAAVSYAAAQISRLTSFGDITTAERNPTPELQALRRAVEHDRYGLMAYVLMARDHCTPTACPAFRSLGDNHQVVANMNDRTYENLITRYAPSWNAVPGVAPMAAAGLVAALPPSVPTGKPTNAEFPSSASTPPVSIMTPEPTKPAAPARPAASAKRAAPRHAPVQIAPAVPPAAPAPSAPAAASQN